jgi:hypothetical protein
VGLLCSEFLELYYRVIKEEQSLRQPFLTKGEKSPARYTRRARVIIFSAATDCRCAGRLSTAVCCPVRTTCLSAAVCRYAMRPVLAVYRCAAAGSYRGRYAAGLRPLSPEAAGIIGGKRQEESANDIAADNKTLFFITTSYIFMCLEISANKNGETMEFLLISVIRSAGD